MKLLLLLVLCLPISSVSAIEWNCKSRNTGFVYKASIKFYDLYIFDRSGKEVQRFENLDFDTHFTRVDQYTEFQERRFTQGRHLVFSIMSKNNRMLTGVFGTDKSLVCNMSID